MSSWIDVLLVLMEYATTSSSWNMLASSTYVLIAFVCEFSLACMNFFSKQATGLDA